MRQLITRIDDDLHRRLKQRAAEQDRSLNDLVTSILEAAVRDKAESLRQRIESSGLRAYPPPSTRPRTRSYEEVLESTRGMGTAASDALAAERDASW
jgi:plasmid stability protein